MLTSLIQPVFRSTDEFPYMVLPKGKTHEDYEFHVHAGPGGVLIVPASITADGREHLYFLPQPFSVAPEDAEVKP